MRALPSAVRRPVLAAALAAWCLLSVASVAVAAGEGEWRRVELPAATPSRVNAVTWGLDQFVAVGSEGADPRPAVWRSPDGASWQVVSDITEETEPSVMRDVAVASPGFVAVGSVGDDGAMWSAFAEADGWRRVLVASFLGAEMHAVESTWAGTIAVGFDTDTQSAGIWRDDGNVWTQVPAGLRGNQPARHRDRQLRPARGGRGCA